MALKVEMFDSQRVNSLFSSSSRQIRILNAENPGIQGLHRCLIPSHRVSVPGFSWRVDTWQYHKIATLGLVRKIWFSTFWAIPLSIAKFYLMFIETKKFWTWRESSGPSMQWKQGLNWLSQYAHMRKCCGSFLKSFGCARGMESPRSSKEHMGDHSFS